MSGDLEHIGKAVQSCKDDALHCLVGERLGGGAHRQVFALALDPTKVIKIEERSRSFCNIHEYEVWNVARHSKFGVWFAPVVSISPTGSALVMVRTRPVTELPAEVPRFFTDIKLANWGQLPDGRVVCHDYGFTRLIGRGLGPAMQKTALYDEHEMYA